MSQCISSYQKPSAGCTQDPGHGQLATATGAGVRGSCLGTASFPSGLPKPPAFCEPMTPWVHPPFIHDDSMNTYWGVHARPGLAKSHNDWERSTPLQSILEVGKLRHREVKECGELIVKWDMHLEFEATSHAHCPVVTVHAPFLS